VNRLTIKASCAAHLQDQDTYKSMVKDQITKFCEGFENSDEYMIVYVTTQDTNKNKSQFKLRGSVFDKIKADFGGNNEAYVDCPKPFLAVFFTIGMFSESWGSPLAQVTDNWKPWMPRLPHRMIFFCGLWQHVILPDACNCAWARRQHRMIFFVVYGNTLSCQMRAIAPGRDDSIA
jgi:hypothetical protein